MKASTDETTTTQEETAVLVVGGGLVGLSAALFLAWQGVPTVLVEKHPGSSPHPRAIGYTPRTLELFRAVGLDERVPQVERGKRLRRVKVESLAGKWFDELHWTPEKEGKPTSTIPEYSPCTGAAIAQDRVEGILRERAIELGADVRLQTKLVRFEQDHDGVTAWLTEASGREYALRASFMIAADGHRSQIRESLEIGRSGRGHIRTVGSVLFRAPLDEYLQRGVQQFSIEQPDFEAFLTTYMDGRWVLMFSDDVQRDEDQLRALVHRAIGRDDLEVEIITTGRWEMSALIAERFSEGRVFLAGDAAHALPPNRGGFGANTGIEDAHNLAWKLSAVLSGRSSMSLLDTYDAERRPIAWLRHDQIFAREDYKRYAGEAAKNVAIIDDQAMEFGQLYRSSAVLGASDELPPALRPEEWAGQPGTRAPHAWISRQDGEDQRLSTLDLLQRDWVLIAGDQEWSEAVAHAVEKLGIKVRCYLIDEDIVSREGEDLRKAFGIGSAGASLVRPDGYLAWRSIDLPSDPRHELTHALTLVSAAK